MTAPDVAKLARMDAAIAGHLNQFWAPKMRRDPMSRFAADPSPLDPLVQKALLLVRVPEER